MDLKYISPYNEITAKVEGEGWTLIVIIVNKKSIMNSWHIFTYLENIGSW